MPKIVDTTFPLQRQGQRTHFARTNTGTIRENTVDCNGAVRGRGGKKVKRERERDCGRWWDHSQQNEIRRPFRRDNFVQSQNMPHNSSYEPFDQGRVHHSQGAEARQHNLHAGEQGGGDQPSHPASIHTDPGEQPQIYPQQNLHPPQVPQRGYWPEAPQIPPRFQIGGKVSSFSTGGPQAGEEHYYQRVDYQQTRNRPYQSIHSGRSSAPYHNSWLHSSEQKEALDTVRRSMKPP